MSNLADLDLSQLQLSQAVTILHDDRIRWWKLGEASPLPAAGFLELVEANHRRNFDLWETEDRARRDDLGPEHVYRAKRAIDRLNQERNNAMERLDEWLMDHLPPVPEGRPMNSESPGQIIDRLSILALKRYHMGLQAERKEAGAEHQAKCAHRLAVIERQRGDLAKALQELIEDVQAGARGFRVYYQMKMYNDPTLNPELYGRRSADQP